MPVFGFSLLSGNGFVNRDSLFNLKMIVSVLFPIAFLLEVQYTVFNRCPVKAQPASMPTRNFGC